ncbi:SDR family oxidoreductase [Rhodococcus sp. PAM 2766]|uniref:SDR family oxidoreductase n=1 Tax=Rhodococcus parequi TaxID=3137122 RepID=A0ABW9FDN3_9NOCA
MGVPGSAADADVAQGLLSAGLAEFSDVTALICCAGVAEPPGSSILDIAFDDWADLIDAHLTSTFRACRVAAPHFVARGGGAIVTTSSYAYLGCYGGSGPDYRAQIEMLHRRGLLSDAMYHGSLPRPNTSHACTPTSSPNCRRTSPDEYSRARVASSASSRIPTRGCWRGEITGPRSLGKLTRSRISCAGDSRSCARVIALSGSGVTGKMLVFQRFCLAG